ncbi:MAG: hypothetical protein IH626_17515 [Rhodospirillales bacterium]|nr:hypothetical protein [Rhodospirillales bacterium]
MSGGIEDQLKALDKDALAALLLKRTGFDEDFRLWLTAELVTLAAREKRTPLDPEPFRRRAEALLEAVHSGRRGRHWDDGSSSVDEAALEELIGQAGPFLSTGDGANAGDPEARRRSLGGILARMRRLGRNPA